MFGSRARLGLGLLTLAAAIAVVARILSPAEPQTESATSPAGRRRAASPPPSAVEVAEPGARVVAKPGAVAEPAPAPLPSREVGALEVVILGPAPQRVALVLDLERRDRPLGDGTLRFEGLTPGPHSAGLIWPERGLTVPRRFESIVIEPGETHRLSFRYPELASISGQLLDPSGRPLGGGALIVRGLYIPVGPEGRFRCRAMPVGRSRLWLYDPEYGAVEVEALRLRRDEDAFIELCFPAQGRAAIVGELRRGGLFAGGATLVLRRINEARSPVVRTTRSDERGRFALRHLAAGRYRLEVDGGPARELVLEGEDEARVELFLDPRSGD